MGDVVESPAKRLKVEQNDYNLKMNDLYLKCESTLSESFCKGKPFKLENDAEVIFDPFTCCVLPDFIQPEDNLKELKQELIQLDMQKKNIDLYKFKQSKDLGNNYSPYISSFKNLLKVVSEWMKNVTKIPLTGKFDFSCSCYTHTDYLLCHDDELDERRIAFIYYLVPEWSAEDGGSLDLFNTGGDGHPTEICKSIVPKWNNFVFFEVSPVSYHQVSEVLTSKSRLSLSGWFHGPPCTSSIPYKETYLFIEPTKQEIDITKWINPIYLDGETQLEIRETFEDNSEISLPGFLKGEMYEEVCKALLDNKIEWCKKGPPNHKIIYEANNDKIPSIVKECQALFSSEAFFLILSNLTALQLHPLSVPDENAKLGKVTSCIRKWCPGSYTILSDQSFSHLCCLNAFMYFNCPEWATKYGGYSSFVAIEDKEELLQIEPSANSLALVYVAEETSHFVKYINSRSTSVFHDIYCMYIEEDDNKSDEE